jgi:PmbA protein
VAAGEPALELAERALAHAGGGDAQATVVREHSLLSRFARSRPTQATRVDDTSVWFLRVHDGHAGAAETNDLAGAGLRQAARRADAAARAAAAAAGKPGDHPGLPGPEPARGHEGLDLDTTRLDPAHAGRALAAAFAACAERDLEAFGVWTAGHVETAIASTTGIRARDQVTDAHLKVIARDARGRSGWGAATASAAGAIDAAAVARGATAKVSPDDPVELEPGEYPVVLEADAVGSLLDFLGWLGFNGLAHAEGRGALAGRLGTRVAASAINVSDSPRFARTLPRAFDFEGVPNRARQPGRVTARARRATRSRPAAPPTARSRRTSSSSAGAPPTSASWPPRSSAACTSRASGTSTRCTSAPRS